MPSLRPRARGARGRSHRRSATGGFIGPERGYGWVHCLFFSADGRTLWSVDPDEGLFGWDLATGVEAVRDRSVRVHARSLIASPDGRTLLDPSSAMLFPLDPREPPSDAASALQGVVLRAWFADDLGVEACVQRGDEIHVLRLSRDGLTAESSQTIVPRGRMRSARQAQAIAEAVAASRGREFSPAEDEHLDRRARRRVARPRATPRSARLLARRPHARAPPLRVCYAQLSGVAIVAG